MAVISKVKIANMALSHIGKSKIEAIDENSPGAKACNLWYDYARIECLEAFDWSFARRRVALSESSEDPPEDLWTYRYNFPSGVVAARHLENPLGPDADAVPFEIELNAAGDAKTILTDLEEAKLVFTGDIEAVGLFSSHFVATLSYRLAHHIAFELTGKNALKAEMANAYLGYIQRAPAQDANTSVARPPRDADWIRGRL